MEASIACGSAGEESTPGVAGGVEGELRPGWEHIKHYKTNRIGAWRSRTWLCERGITRTCRENMHRSNRSWHVVSHIQKIEVGQ